MVADLAGKWHGADKVTIWHLVHEHACGTRGHSGVEPGVIVVYGKGHADAGCMALYECRRSGNLL